MCAGFSPHTFLYGSLWSRVGVTYFEALPLMKRLCFLVFVCLVTASAVNAIGHGQRNLTPAVANPAARSQSSILSAASGSQAWIELSHNQSPFQTQWWPLCLMMALVGFSLHWGGRR